MSRKLRTTLGLGFGALVLGTAAIAAPPGKIDTIAGRLEKLDRFENKENENGLDRFRADGRNWYDYDILFAAVLADETLIPAVTSPETAVTLFAPNDRAFQKLAYDLTGEWIVEEQELFDAIVMAVEAGLVNLNNVLNYHIVDGKVERADVPFDVPVTTLNGDTITFKKRFFGLLTEIVDSVDDFQNPFLWKTDLDAGESVVHGISRVLIPSNVGG